MSFSTNNLHTFIVYPELNDIPFCCSKSLGYAYLQMVFFHSDLPWCKVKSHLKQIQNWLVVSTHLKNMTSQNGSLPQFSGTFKKNRNHHPENIMVLPFFQNKKHPKSLFFFLPKNLPRLSWAARTAADGNRCWWVFPTCFFTKK